ncbi:hypothetical protein FRC09_000771 [Ceratobasidium sp. 395]|nr:hypothetical protein FRC09_000771 [Ceratobasidium sp. 395]
MMVTIGNSSIANDKALDSYKCDDPVDANEAVCWIVIPPSHRFCVHVGYNGMSQPQPDAGIKFKLYIDGAGPISSAFISPETIRDDIARRERNAPLTELKGEIEMDGRFSKVDGTIQPLCFYKRRTTDNDSGILPRNLRRFGEIEIRACWAVEESGPPPLYEDPELELLTKPVDEKLKQVQYQFIGGLGQSVKDPDRNARQPEIDTTPIQPNEIRFIFRYSDQVLWALNTFAPVEWLKSEGIAPRHAK